VLRGLIIAACLFCSGILRANQDDSIRAGQELISDVLAQFPLEPVDLKGDILCRKRHGMPLKELKFEVRMRLGEEKPSVVYSIMDAFGRHLETLVVTPDTAKGCSYSYRKGNDDEDAQVPNLFEPIQETDITWADLSLGFLRWTNAAVTGRQEVRGRKCLVVLVSPASSDCAAAGTGAYAAVRVWIDEKLHFMLQAQGLDTNGRAVRTLWVRSVKKMGERWMVKDIEVQSDPSRRTKLTVREINGTDSAASGGSSGGQSAEDFLQPEQVEDSR